MSELSVNHLLGIKYLQEKDIKLIFETADHFKEVINRPVMRHPNPGAGVFLSKHVGDILHSRVALSNIFALQLQGAQVMVCGPKTLIPKYINELGVKVETNLRKALNWCDVANMLRVQNERMDISYFPSTREYTQQFGVTKDLLDSLDKEITIMHPGPINRGVEITSDVADSKQSIILDQVQNGVAIRMAVIYLLASKIKQ